MPPLDPDWPWWVSALIVVLGLAATSAVSVWVAMIQTRQKLEAVREQVQNSHTQSNLRHDVDRANEGISMLAEGVERVERRIDDVDRSIRAERKSADRRYAIQQRDLEDAVEDGERAIQTLTDEIPGRLRDALEEHVAACTLRTPTKEDHHD